VARLSPHGDPHIYDTRLFPWVKEVEQEWRLIRAELDAVMKFRDKMPSFQDILKEVGAIQSDNNWKTFFLAGIGMDCTENRKRCPETVRLLGKIPGLTTAFFSILSPGHGRLPRGVVCGLCPATVSAVSLVEPAVVEFRRFGAVFTRSRRETETLAGCILEEVVAVVRPT
jgi:hypothetical protein